MSRASDAMGEELLSWEDLRSRGAFEAFRESLFELLFRPTRFFGKMALSGGLLEPLSFFCIVLGAVVLAAFAAAFAYFWLAAPDPATVSAEQYQEWMLLPEVTGMTLLLLPEVLAVSAGSMLLLGSLFHLPGRLFGARTWEGSISVWLYSAAAALIPLLALLILSGLFSCAGLLAAALRLPAGPAFAAGARWLSLIGIGLGGVALVGVLPALASIGYARAFGLDGISGAAAGVGGTVFALAAVGALAWLGLRLGVGGGLSAYAAGAVAALALAGAGLVVSILVRRRSRR